MTVKESTRVTFPRRRDGWESGVYPGPPGHGVSRPESDNLGDKAEIKERNFRQRGDPPGYGRGASN